MSIYCTQKDWTISIYEQQNCTDDSIVWQLVVERGSSVRDWVDLESDTLTGVLVKLEKWIEKQ